MREALQLYEKNPEKGMPMEYRVVPATPYHARGRYHRGDTAVDQNPEVRRLREDVQKFMRDVMGTLGKIGLPGSQSKGSTDK